MLRAHWDGETLAIRPGRDQARCAGRRRRRGTLAHLFPEHLQSGAAEGEGDAGGDAEEILAEPAGGLAHSRLIAGAEEAAREMIARMPTDAGAASRQGPGEALAERASPTEAERRRECRDDRRVARGRQGLPPLPAVARRNADRVRRGAGRREGRVRRRTARRPGGHRRQAVRRPGRQGLRRDPGGGRRRPARRSTSPMRSSTSSSSRAASAASTRSRMPARSRPAAGGWTRNWR